MWQCPTCGERLERQFDACWNCGTERDSKQGVAPCRENDGSQEERGEATNPYLSPQAEPTCYVNAARSSRAGLSAVGLELLDHTRRSIWVTAVITALGGVVMLVQFLIGLHRHLTFEAPFPFLHTWTLDDLLLGGKGVLGFGCPVIAFLLIRYAASIRKLTHGEAGGLDDVLRKHKTLWGVTFFVAICCVVGILITIGWSFTT